MLAELVELFALELRVVHLPEDVDHILEVVAALLEIVEDKFAVADAEHQLQHIFLALERTEGVDFVESVLLEDDEVHELALPENLVIVHRHAVIAQDVDLFAGVTALADDVFAATEYISNNIRIGNTDYIRSHIRNMQKEYYLDNADIAPFMKRLDVFDKAKGKSIIKERAQEKPSIRKQLADNKAKAASTPKRTKQKNKDLEV